MELSLEAYRIIVNNVQIRADLARLCLVSKGFRRVAERALYNTLYMRQLERTRRLCETLEAQARVAELVEALYIAIEDEKQEGMKVEEDTEEEVEGEVEGEGGGEEERGEGGNVVEEERNDQDESEGLAESLAMSFKSGFSNMFDAVKDIWPAISRSLQNMSRLRHLNILINGSSSGNLGWILVNSSFRLKSFHSDLRWDEDLVRFLNAQDEIEDLFLGDYDEGEEAEQGETLEEKGVDEATSPARHSIEYIPSPPSRSTRILSQSALPHLTTLECTFSEAAIALVPGRPVSRLKTCFSSMDPVGKRAEMGLLFAALGRATIKRLSGKPRGDSRAVSRRSTTKKHKFLGGWLALDIADAEYEEEFTMELLRTAADLTLVGPGPRFGTAGLTTAKGTLRYLGTLVLPVGGQERLHLYGLLMQLRRICCIELEVSSWEPSPASVGAVAFRALGNELRLYCPGVCKVVFISMGPVAGGADYEAIVGERTTVEYVRGQAVGRVEREFMTGMNGLGGSEGLWRYV